MSLGKAPEDWRTPKRWREIRWHPKSAKRLGLRRPSAAFPNGISNCANVTWHCHGLTVTDEMSPPCNRQIGRQKSQPDDIVVGPTFDLHQC
jgi:hypothetical protein